LTSLSSQKITNAGSFSAEEGGTLIIHMNWDGIDLREDDQITFRFTINP